MCYLFPALGKGHFGVVVVLVVCVCGRDGVFGWVSVGVVVYVRVIVVGVLLVKL